MCKKRELTEEPLINGINRSIDERSIHALTRKQLALMTLMDPEKGKTVFREIVSIMKELKDIDAMCTCGSN